MEQSLGDFDDLNFDDFNLDFDTEEHVNYLDVNAICLQTTSYKLHLKNALLLISTNKLNKSKNSLIDCQTRMRRFTLSAGNLDFHRLQ